MDHEPGGEECGRVPSCRGVCSVVHWGPRALRKQEKIAEDAPAACQMRTWVVWSRMDIILVGSTSHKNPLWLKRPPQGRRLHVARSARKQSAEHTARFHTSTGPFYAIRRACASPGRVSVEIDPKLREALFSRAERPPPARRRLSTLAAAAHNAPTRKTAQQKGRAAALPERAARAKFHRAHPRRRHPKLFTSLCARKRAQNINSRAPATHRT